MTEMCSSNGQLILVVGASGSGKDTLLIGASKVLSENLEFVFIQREITRPADAGGENHIAISQKVFNARLANGEYALCWTANGLSYGIGKTLDRSLKEGKTVILNGSRGAIRDIKKKYPTVKIIQITVSKNILRKRLKERGRETEKEIEERLERGQSLRLRGNKIYYFANDQPLDVSLKSFVSFLTVVK